MLDEASLVSSNTQLVAELPTSVSLRVFACVKTLVIARIVLPILVTVLFVKTAVLVTCNVSPTVMPNYIVFIVQRLETIILESKPKSKAVVLLFTRPI